MFTLSSRWLLVIFTFALIGRCDYFGFGLRHSIEKRSLNDTNTKIKSNANKVYVHFATTGRKIASHEK